MNSPALRALLEGLIDYAGLFPPAGLPMAEAYAEYLRHRSGPAAWLLGSFICPAARLPELADLVSPADGVLHLVLLASRAGSGSAAASLGDDLSSWRTFAAAHGGRAAVRAWELRLPADAPAGEPLPEWLAGVAAPLPARTAVFWEADPAWEEDRLRALAATLAGLNAAGGRHGLKLRCGGVTAAEFPPVDRVAAHIALARDHDLPLKCTAGLHHPLRQFRPELGAWMHGFLNVWLAAAAARVHGLEVADLIPLLQETDAAAFRVDGPLLAWRGLGLSAAEIAAARPWLPGHGSCSLDEPVADLAALGWLPHHQASGDTA